VAEAEAEVAEAVAAAVAAADRVAATLNKVDRSPPSALIVWDVPDQVVLTAFPGLFEMASTRCRSAGFRRRSVSLVVGFGFGLRVAGTSKNQVDREAPRLDRARPRALGDHAAPE
jgi:hypothetical protein